MPVAAALLHEEDGVFGVSFPDFPGCIATGRSAEIALRKASEALTFHVAGMAADGEPIASPRDLATLRTDPDFIADSEGAAIALVPFELPGRSIRLNISMEETLVDAVDRAARAAGQSRSAYLAEAARQHLKHHG